MPTSAPVAAKPTKHIFDPFNSSATGHQRAENRLGGSTSWRDSRSSKLRNQFAADAGGGKRVSDTVGAGSLDFGLDGRTESGGWIPGAAGLRGAGQQSLWETLKVTKPSDEDIDERPVKRAKLEPGSPRPTTVVNPFTPFRRQDGTVRESSWTSHEASPSELLEPLHTPECPTPSVRNAIKKEESVVEDKLETRITPPCPNIFANLTFYINGSTAPHSDHRIKSLLSRHGGQISISLGRKTVTHVIIGKPSSSGGLSGGGLAATKIQKEIAEMKGAQKVRYVSADWIVESVAAGKRLPESRYEALRLAPKGVSNIASAFTLKDSG